MYGTMLRIHSIVRWLALLGIIIPLLSSYVALARPRPFSKGDSTGIRIGTSAAHTQLLIGLGLYFSSPFVKLFWSDPSAGVANLQVLFFSLIHITGMLTAVVLMTIGSSKLRRQENDRDKFRTLAIFWTLALLLILAIIPWPFSPFAQRPLWRPL